MAHRTYKTGQDRGRVSLLPPRIEDYVGADNPVRLIDALVDGLDLAALGFSNTDASSGPGQPAFAPGDLLKLYLYGYINRVRSSRRLEQETRRNLEVLWLLKGLSPGYRTIASFRRVNAAGLKATTRQLLALADKLGLVGGELVAIDGAFFDANASKASILTQTRLAERLAKLERDIAAYDETLACNDAAEDSALAEDIAPAEDGALDKLDVSHGTAPADAAERLAELHRRKQQIEASIATLQASGQTQLSRTDADARLVSKSGQVVAGYNVQIAVDAKAKLIVASDVVSDGNDTRQLHAMAAAAKQELGVAALTVVADAGYYNASLIKACEADAITPYVPQPDRGGRALAEGRFSQADFTYDPVSDRFDCPGKHMLGPCGGKRDAAGTWMTRYASTRRVCAACPLRDRCLTAKATRREIWRSEHAAVIERHCARMGSGEALLKQRKALAEHPFGTLKCRAGYRHFLVRGLTRVRGELALMVAGYNVTRLISILGHTALLAALRAVLHTCFLALCHFMASAALPGRHKPAKPRIPSRNTNHTRCAVLPA